MSWVHRAFAASAAVGLVAAGTLAAHAPSAAADSTTSNMDPIDLSDPLAGIDDPSAGIPVTTMVCADGQIDLNHATADQLGAELEVADPVASRIVEHRPYLAVSDLVVVEGIRDGGRLDAIESSGVACATPRTLPPAVTPDVCTDDDARVDLHHTTVAELVTRLGLGVPVAQRVLAGIPYASTAHLTRVAGIGPGGLGLIEPLVCITPAPFDTDTGPWRWATTTGGGHVEDGDYQLAVPPGVIDEEAGAWLEIDVLEPNPGPSADFVVHGDRDGKVLVTIPRLPAAHTPDGWDHPIVLHNPDHPDLLWGPANLHQGDATLTLATDTLSPYSSSQFGGNEHIDLCLLYAPDSNNDPHAPQTPDGLMSCAFKNYLASLPTDPPEVELPGCEDTAAIVTNAYVAEWAIGCSRADHGATAEWTFTNTTDEATAGLAGVGAVASVSRDVHASLSYQPNETDLAVVIARALSGSANTNVVFPGDRVVASVAEENQARVDFDKHLAHTAALFGAASAMDLVTKQLPSDRAEAVVDCALDAVGSDVDSAFQAAGSCARTNLDTWADGLADAAAKAKAKAKSSNLFIMLVGTLIDALVAGAQLSAFDHDAHVTMIHRPPRPTVDAENRPIRDNCVTPSGATWIIDSGCQDAFYDQPATGGGTSGLPEGWIVQNADGNAWLYNADDGLYHSIPTGGDYECLAYHYWVDWYQESPRDSAIGDDATCPPGDVPPQRAPFMTPESALWKVSVLREPSGRAWMVYRGGRFEIPNGYEFNCFVAPPEDWIHEYHVWDQVTQAELDNFPILPPGNTISSCPGF